MTKAQKPRSIVNSKDIKQLLKTDKLFVSISSQYGLPPNWTRPPGFISLSRIILEQQVSLTSANAHYLKLNKYIAAFTPANILALSDQEMRDCQISRQKANYLRALSGAILEGVIDLEAMNRMDEQEVRKKLTALKGIGNWTADVYLMFCLKSKDIFPIGDIAIVNTMKELSGAKTMEEMILLADTWKPLRSLAAFFLWHYYLKKRNRP